jgi:hypothetical protein
MNPPTLKHAISYRVDSPPTAWKGMYCVGLQAAPRQAAHMDGAALKLARLLRPSQMPESRGLAWPGFSTKIEATRGFLRTLLSHASGRDPSRWLCYGPNPVSSRGLQ